MSEAEENIQFKGHVLVADDNKTNQIIISILLQERGLSCDFADNGKIATQMYNPDIHDLLLMDEDMPIMDGLMALKILKEKYKSRCGPIVAFTADVISITKENFLALGMDDYISKPIMINELNRILKKFLKQV